jgi:hypothetical protein
VPGDNKQKVEVSNVGTHGNVSVHGIVLRGPLPASTEKTLLVNDNAVRPEGAWRIRTDDNITSYEDNNENKGASSIVFPVAVEQPGKYQVTFLWRAFKRDGEGRGTRPAWSPGPGRR